MDHPLVRPMLLLAAVLVAPLLILAFWGEAFTEQLEIWQAAPPPRPAVAAAVIGILATDVFLPIPSGPVSTLAGGQLGVILGTLVSTLGMTLGAAIAFAMARRWGRPLAERLASPSQLLEAESACLAHGPWVLVLTRPLPVLAEACCLLVGGLRMSWRRFLPSVVVSNFVIAAAYSALGNQAAQHDWLPLALCVAAAAPLAMAVWWRKRLTRSQDVTETADAE